MKLKLNAILAAAVAVFAVSGANATLSLNGNTAGNGDGSVLFVALDNSGTTGLNSVGNSVTIDLGALMTDLLAGPGTQGVPLTQSTYQAGALSGPGTNVVWNFANNSETINGVASTNTIAYSGAYTSFLSAVTTAGHTFNWGVVASEVSNTGTTATAGNPIANQNTLMTLSNPSTAYIKLPSTTQASTAPVAYNNLVTATLGQGTQSTAANTQGANYATTGGAYVGTSLKTTFNGNLPNFSTSGSTTASMYVQWIQQAATTKLYTLDGVSYSSGLNAPVGSDPATFTFDPTASTLTFSIGAVSPVPEPDSYAMLFAGLAAIGFIVRRRNAA